MTTPSLDRIIYALSAVMNMEVTVKQEEVKV